jgi:predicted AAA+ superfamily ATPase
VKRTLYKDLTNWRASKSRKPLLLRGARQTGKTYILRAFGRAEYQGIAYFDFEQDPKLASFFDRDLDPHRIVSELGVYRGRSIAPGKDLIVFDEIQASNRALLSLKYFSEEGSEHHVAAAGSLLGVNLSRPGSFPVGKVDLLDLHPMSFSEFLVAMGREGYASLLHEIDRIEPIADAIHIDLIDLLGKFYFVGGMPEAVRAFSESRDADEVRRIQHGILQSYTLDFAKHAPTTDIPKLGLTWDSIPRHLAKENKKFMFSVVRKGARSREYENALRWLEDAGLVHLCHAATSSRVPLAHYADRGVFKVYPLDVGLLSAMARVSTRQIVESGAIFTEFRGALTESFAAQQLRINGCRDLFYWRSSGGKAELDFLVELEDRVIPVEIKAGRRRHSKSLASYRNQYHPEVMVRATLRNLKHDGDILNIPLYAVHTMNHLLKITLPS